MAYSNIIEESLEHIDRLEDAIKNVRKLKTRLANRKSTFGKGVKESIEKTLSEALTEIEHDVDEIGLIIDDNMEEIEEAVQRQFRRYGDTFKRQYRCTTGDKAGRIVTQPSKCGIRKDPRRVRIGKKASRAKKGQRVRKTQFAKRRTQSKRLTRLNKTLRGDS